MDSPELRMLPDHWQSPGLYAGFWRRVVTWFVDGVILTVGYWFLVAVLGRHALAPWPLSDSMTAMGAWMPLWFATTLQPLAVVVAWLYFALFETSGWQATPGKRALGLRVTDEFGRRIGFMRATGRCFGKFVSALLLGIGFLLAGWTARKQALHDLMAACCVVRANGLAAWLGGPEASPAAAATPAAATPPRPTGMPAWAIVLVVIGGTAFLWVPLLAIMAAIAVPVYEGYVVRGEVARGLGVTTRARALVGQYIGERGSLPRDNADLGLPRPDSIRGRHVTSVRVADGKVVVTFGGQASPEIRGGHVVMSPEGNAAMLRWRCSSPDIRVRFLPRSCRE